MGACFLAPELLNTSSLFHLYPGWCRKGQDAREWLALAKPSLVWKTFHLQSCSLPSTHSSLPFHTLLGCVSQSTCSSVFPLLSSSSCSLVINLMVLHVKTLILLVWWCPMWSNCCCRENQPFFFPFSLPPVVAFIFIFTNFWQTGRHYRWAFCNTFVLRLHHTGCITLNSSRFLQVTLFKAWKSIFSCMWKHFASWICLHCPFSFLMQKRQGPC